MSAEDVTKLLQCNHDLNALLTENQETLDSAIDLIESIRCYFDQNEMEKEHQKLYEDIILFCASCESPTEEVREKNNAILFTQRQKEKEQLERNIAQCQHRLNQVKTELSALDVQRKELKTLSIAINSATQSLEKTKAEYELVAKQCVQKEKDKSRLVEEIRKQNVIFFDLKEKSEQQRGVCQSLQAQQQAMPVLIPTPPSSEHDHGTSDVKERPKNESELEQELEMVEQILMETQARLEQLLSFSDVDWFVS